MVEAVGVTVTVTTSVVGRRRCWWVWRTRWRRCPPAVGGAAGEQGAGAAVAAATDRPRRCLPAGQRQVPTPARAVVADQRAE